MSETQAPNQTATESHFSPAEAEQQASIGRRLRRLPVRTIAALEHTLARGGDVVWRAFKHRPALGVSAATMAGLAMASALGASELAIAFAAGVAAYQMLKKNEPPSQALADAAKFGL